METTALPEANQQPVSAQVIANAFVQQYYHILHHTPEFVHKFYQETSKLGRPDVDGSMGITTTMDGINEKIVSLNFGDYRAEIRSVDALHSFSGGVQVLVTGYLTGQDNRILNFSQSFFLAPQDGGGYFVLTDIFRVIDGNLAPVIAAMAPVVPEQNPLPLAEDKHVSREDTSAKEVVEDEVYNPSEIGDVPVVKEEVAVVEVIDEIHDDSQLVTDLNIDVEIPPKKSYASIVMNLKKSAATFSPLAPAMRKSVPKIQEQANPPVPEADLQVPHSDVDSGGNQDSEAEGYSIYIKGLPMNATVSLLENEFNKFGPIKSGGVQVRSNRQQGICFGFVEFEVPSAVEKAIEASPIAIGGHQTVIEGKRSTNSRGFNRGRFQPGRGSGFRNDWGARGRGNYGGGRGYNRVDSNNRNEFNARGGSNRGGLSNHVGDGYERPDSNNGRMNRAGAGAGRMANGTRLTAPQISASA